MADSKVVVYEAEFPRDTNVVSTLFTAYAKSLPIDLSFQNFDAELSSLPGKYASSMGGTIFLSHKSFLETGAAATVLQDLEVIGCAALRAFNAPHSCELKRLYITPESRRLGSGRKLLESAIAKAKQMGYAEMLLDTLPRMTAARKMYADYGFEEREKYYDSPIEGAVFMKLKLKWGGEEILSKIRFRNKRRENHEVETARLDQFLTQQYQPTVRLSNFRPPPGQKNQKISSDAFSNSTVHRWYLDLARSHGPYVYSNHGTGAIANAINPSVLVA